MGETHRGYEGWPPPHGKGEELPPLKAVRGEPASHGEVEEIKFTVISFHS